MAEPLSKVLLDKLDIAKANTQLRLFKDFVDCKDDESRKIIGAKMDCLNDVINVYKKELKNTII